MRKYIFFQQDVTNPPPPPPPPPPYTGSTPPIEGKASNNALWSMILGIASWVLGCGILTGIPAWIMGKKEINEIEAGRSSRAGLTMAKVGMWLGLINTILAIFIIFILIIVILIGGLSSLPFIDQ